MFKFRLEPLLAIRDNILKEKQADLAKAYDAHRIVETKRIEVLHEIDANNESARLMQRSGNVQVDFLLGVRQYEAYLRSQLEAIRAHLKQIEAVIEERRNAVITANKELKIIEKLKENQRGKYDAVQRKKETVLMDEIGERKRITEDI